MQLTINYYCDKEVMTIIIGNALAPKLEIKEKCVVINDGEITKFACKCSDFISMSF